MFTSLAHDDPHGFGAYTLLARMGSGGMGAVYLARSPGGRTVALKTMHARFAADPALRDRFQLEVDAARVIGERFGAGVVEAEVRAETPWFAAEYVLGPPLGTAVGLAGPLPEATVRALGAALCGALGQLHRSDVVHRDLKPSNVLLTAHGPKVIDFGIARALGDARLTATGAAAGTPAFMSPEQAAGHEHGPSGDVFALAGVLVFAASGHGPFGEGLPADLLYRVRYADPDLGGVPEALVPLLARCLGKDPATRPTTGVLMTQLHDGQGEFADHLPPGLLVDIGRRATEVWHPPPERLPAPPRADGEDGGGAAAGTGDATASKGLTRRGLLAIGGGSVLAVAAGAGAWAAVAGASGEKPAPYKKPPPGPSVSAAPGKPDWRWQTQIVSPEVDSIPPFPLRAGNLVVIRSGDGHLGIEARSGQQRWFSEEFEDTWETVSDGKRVLRLVDLDEEKDRGARAKHVPLTIAAVDPADGSRDKPLAQLDEYNGILYYNQLICAEGGVLYLVAGAGERSWKKFVRGDSWFLVAVRASTGEKLWSSPLPPRSTGDRIYVLDAAVEGNRLVLYQQTNDGKVRVAAHDKDSGRAVWDKPFAGSPGGSIGRLRTGDGHVYLGGDTLRALRLSDGGEAWSVSPREDGKAAFGAPCSADGAVYAVEKGQGLVALDPGSGKRKWTEKNVGKGAVDVVRAFLDDPPVVARGHAYVHGPSGLRAVALSSRTTVRTYRTKGTRFTHDPENEVILAAGGNFLAAFDLM